MQITATQCMEMQERNVREGRWGEKKEEDWKKKVVQGEAAKQPAKPRREGGGGEGG